MIQALYQKAMKFAGAKHANQQVPGTEANYLLHLSNVAMEVLVAYYEGEKFDINFAIQVAILHDTLEDTSTDYDALKNEFGVDIADAVQALTKDDTLPTKKAKMADSLHRINLLQPEVGLVKLADRITNLQAPPQHWDHDKISSYWAEAKTIAAILNHKNEYLTNRLNRKIAEYEQYLNRQ